MSRRRVPTRVSGSVDGRPIGLRIVDVTVLAVAVMAACGPLFPVYGDVSALPAIAGGALAGAAIAVSASRLPLTVALLCLVAGYVVAGTALWVEGALAGVVPTASTLGVLARGPVTTWSRVLTLPAPLGDDGEALVAACLIALLGAFVAGSIAVRATTASWAQSAAVVPFGVLAVALVFASDRSLAAVAVGVGMAALLAFWAAWRAGRLRTRRPLALVVVVAALAAGGATAPSVVVADRVQVRERVRPPVDLSDLPSPLSAFRRYVKDGDEAMLTVSGLPAGAPVRLATMETYDGLTWNVAGGGDATAAGFRRVSRDGRVAGAPSAGGGGADAGGAGAGGAGAGGEGGAGADTSGHVSITIGALGGVWVPTVGVPTAIRSAQGTALPGLQADAATQTAILPGGLDHGMRYTLDTRWSPRPSDEQLAKAPAADAPLAAVSGAPAAVAEIAATVGRPREAKGGQASGRETEGHARLTGGALAERIAADLSARGYFSHGLVGDGDYPSLSGHGAERMSTFLTGDVMVGDDEQYASAMALVARELGLPARVVLGFRAEEGSGDRTQTRTFTGRDISAWVEVDLRGYGWVPFYPTPPESKRPDSGAPQPTPEPTTRAQQEPPRQPEPSRAPGARAQTPPADDAEPPREGVDWRPTVLVAGGSALALLALLAPFAAIVIAKATRRRRRRREPEPLRRVVGGWDEVLALASDHGLVLARTATRAEKAQTLSERWPLEQAVLVEELADRADTAVFGDGRTAADDAERFWALVDELRADIAAGSGWRGRLRARFSVRSLRRQGRVPRWRSARRRGARGRE